MSEEPKRFPLTVEGIEAALKYSGSSEARKNYIESLQATIAEFEERYQMRSDELLQLLGSGALAREDLDLAKWLLTIQALGGIFERFSEDEPDEPDDLHS